MHARRVRRARVACRSARAAPSLRTERRPKRRRETRATIDGRLKAHFTSAPRGSGAPRASAPVYTPTHAELAAREPRGAEHLMGTVAREMSHEMCQSRDGNGGEHGFVSRPRVKELLDRDKQVPLRFFVSASPASTRATARWHGTNSGLSWVPLAEFKPLSDTQAPQYSHDSLNCTTLNARPETRLCPFVKL